LEGSITGYQWSYVSGPSDGLIDRPDSSRTLLGNLSAGVHIYRLQVTDNFGRTDADSITIRVVEGRILFDVGNSTLTASPDANGNHWNNMISGLPGIQVAGAVTTGNLSTSVSLEVINRADGTYEPNSDPVFTNTPLGVVGPVGDYPASATDDFTFTHSSATDGKWRISGLDAGKTHTVKFWGARLAENRRIDIRLSGDSVWQTYDAANNRDYNRAAVFTFAGRTEVDFDIRSNQASTFGIISIIDITFVNTPVQNRPAYSSVSTGIKPRNTLSNIISGSDKSLKVYPVPVRRGQELVIESGINLPGEMMLINTQGIPVLRFRAAKITRLPTSALAKGVYRIWNGHKVLASIVAVE